MAKKYNVRDKRAKSTVYRQKPETPETPPKKPKTFKTVVNYFIAIVMLLAILAAIGLGGKWLLQELEKQNNKISALQDKSDLRETSEKVWNRQLSQLKTTLTGQLTELANKQNDKLNGLTAQLQTWKEQTTTSIQQQQAKIEKLAAQASQLNTDLLSLKEETTASIQQQQAKIEELAVQSSQLNTDLLSLKEETAASDLQHNVKIFELSDQIGKLNTETSQLNTALQTLRTDVTALVEK